jgi:type II secretory pathway pseudopilin PulG
MSRSICRQRSHRRGVISVLSAVFLVALLGMVAFAVDVGYLALARSELQNAADAAATAGTAGLIDAPSHALSEAQTFGEHNDAASRGVKVVPAEDVSIGLWNFQTRTFQPLSGAALAQANAVQVDAKLVNGRGTSAQLFFSRIFGRNSVEMNAVATAALWSDLRGFRVPPNGENLPLLPIALDLQTWQDAMAGSGSDNWSWDSSADQTSISSDGQPEVNLYPDGGTGASGNRGLIEIGSNGGKVGTLRQQIRDGIRPSDMNDHGGSLELNSQGELPIGGQPGVKATLQNELSAIVGETRIVPIFDQVSGSGSNASYTIVRFGGVRIMHVDLSGSPKQIIAQPTYVYVHGAIPDTSSVSSSSDKIYSLPRLVQ